MGGGERNQGQGAGLTIAGLKEQKSRTGQRPHTITCTQHLSWRAGCQVVRRWRTMTRYDDSDDTGGNEPRGRRRGRGSRRRRIVGWIAVLTTVLVTGSSLAAYAKYLGTLHSIETFSTSNLGTHRPPVFNASVNILLVGSDSRAGSNEKFGKNIQGQRSDTMLLVHIRPNHKGAVVVSMPRDT